MKQKIVRVYISKALKGSHHVRIAHILQLTMQFHGYKHFEVITAFVLFTISQSLSSFHICT